MHDISRIFLFHQKEEKLFCRTQEMEVKLNRHQVSLIVSSGHHLHLPTDSKNVCLSTNTVIVTKHIALVYFIVLKSGKKMYISRKVKYEVKYHT